MTDQEFLKLHDSSVVLKFIIVLDTLPVDLNDDRLSEFTIRQLCSAFDQFQFHGLCHLPERSMYKAQRVVWLVSLSWMRTKLALEQSKPCKTWEEKTQEMLQLILFKVELVENLIAAEDPVYDCVRKLKGMFSAHEVSITDKCNDMMFYRVKARLDGLVEAGVLRKIDDKYYLITEFFK